MQYCSVIPQLAAPKPSEGFSAQLGDLIRETWSTLSGFLAHLVWTIGCIVLIFIGARLLLNLISALTGRLMKSGCYDHNEQQGKRADTIITLVRSTTRYIIYCIALLLSLMVLGVGEQVGGLIVTAGIGSVAIGFGAQSFVKDVVTGLFMMFENQFSVGDFIKLDEVEGYVEATALRVTYLRSLKGEQIIIPNGTITRVINYTRGNYMATVTVAVPYEVETGKVIAVIGRSITQWAKEHGQDLLVEEPIVRGITALGPNGVEITCACRVKPLCQWQVERGFRLAIKNEFDRIGLPLAYPVQLESQPPTPHPDFSDYAEEEPVPQSGAAHEDELHQNGDSASL